MRKSRNAVRGSVGIGVVLCEVIRPLFPRDRLALGSRRPVKVGIVITKIGETVSKVGKEVTDRGGREFVLRKSCNTIGGPVEVGVVLR